MNIPLLIVASIFFLAGFWGIFIPLIPDLPLVWFGVFIYSLGTHFASMTVSTVVILGILAASSYLIDHIATLYGAKRYGATRQGIIGGLIGGLVGTFLLPPFGFIIGAITGTLIAEVVVMGRVLPEAIRASKGALAGLIVGLLTKVILASIIIGVFLKSVL